MAESQIGPGGVGHVYVKLGGSTYKRGGAGSE